jgi:hypothetical protein
MNKKSFYIGLIIIGLVLIIRELIVNTPKSDISGLEERLEFGWRFEDARNFIFSKEYQRSEETVRQILTLDSTPIITSIAKIYLAHALLFQNRFSEAVTIYKELSQDKKTNLAQTWYFHNRKEFSQYSTLTYNQVLLKDFEIFEEKDIIPEECKVEVENIRKILQ